MFLFEQLVRRELRQKYQGSVLGIAWYLVNPLVLMAAYWFLFGIVLKAFSYEDYPLFLLCGLVVWIFFSQSLLAASGSLLEQGALIRKARFAREVIPASVVSVQLVTFLVVLALLAVVCVAIRGTLGACGWRCRRSACSGRRTEGRRGIRAMSGSAACRRGSRRRRSGEFAQVMMSPSWRSKTHRSAGEWALCVPSETQGRGGPPGPAAL